MRLLALLLVPIVALVDGTSSPAAGQSLLDPGAGEPPIAQRIETVTEVHGDELVDPYAWLRNETDPAVLDYLAAENDYTDQVMAPLARLEQTLFEEMTGRLAEDDSSHPTRYGDYWYHWRVAEGDEHWNLVRTQSGPDGPVETVIDVNAMAAEHDYFDVVGWDVTLDGRLLSYQTDTTGGIDYDLHLRDLHTGEALGPPISGVSGSLWWPDGRALYYIAVDDALRSYEVRRHVPGADGPDQVIYTETDAEYSVGISLSADNRYLVIGSGASDTSEIRFLDPYLHGAEPFVIRPREPGIWYGATHASGQVIVRINDTGPNFRLVATTLADLEAGNEPTVLIPERPDVVLDGASIFARAILVTARRDGQPYLEIYDRSTGDLRAVPFPERAYSIGSKWNPDYDTDTYVYTYQSHITPYSVYALDMTSGSSILLRREPVPGGYDPMRYQAQRIFATAEDGTRVPISLAFARGTPMDGTAPLLLEAYGAYGSVYDPYFDRTIISLLDRGVIFAFAHVRGGGEYGDPWYDGGRLAEKMNTFTDTIAVAEHLAAEGYTSPDRMVLTGASAGGLTVGAVLNLRPDLFTAAILNVPFVDVITVMLDPSLPLTTLEYPEWGNPEVAEEYAWIRAYDPYFNLADRDYPAMLVLTGLGDDQVPFWQPAKYIARVRALTGGDSLALLATDMDSGHGGDAGRYEGYRRWAFQYAFLLGVVGIGE